MISLRKKITMEILELVFKTTDKGVYIPNDVLEEIGVGIGESVYIIYYENDTIKEFLLLPHSIADIDRELVIQIPNELLTAARIEENSDIYIACLNGAILLVGENVLDSQSLLKMLDSIEIGNEILENIPMDAEKAKNELKSLAEDLERFVKEEQ